MGSSGRSGRAFKAVGAYQHRCLALVALAALVLSVALGSVTLAPGEILAVLRGQGSPLAQTLILELRLPRSLSAFAVGGLNTLRVALAGIAGLIAVMPVRAQVSIDADDIGGVVTGPRGPEAGVWVIAETTDLPTRMSKMVVTDDQGGRLFVCSDTDHCETRRAAGHVGPEGVA